MYAPTRQKQNRLKIVDRSSDFHYLLLATGFFVALIAIFGSFFYLRNRVVQRDVGGAPFQNGVATVVRSGVLAYGKYGAIRPYVFLRFRGAEYQYEFGGQVDLTELSAGRQVTITYRQGKSGEVYIDSVRTP